MGTILIILGIYLLYKFVVDFVIPVYKASKKVQERFRNMQQHMKDNGHNGHYSTSAHADSNHSKVSSKDYIDFEEIKN